MTAKIKPTAIPAVGMIKAYGISLSGTFKPADAILSLSIPWKICPNPTGRTIYGAVSPNVITHAISLRSISSSLNIFKSGGINTGINAM